MAKSVTIAGRVVDADHSPFIIAEMSGNHNGQIERAFALLEAAKASGANAVKLQTYTADTITIDHDSPSFRIEGGLWHGRRLYELYQEAHTPWEWHEALFAKCRELDLTIFSTPFDNSAVDFLDRLGAAAYKIASFEAIDLPLIRYASSKGKPLIISTGMANLNEIGEAVAAAREGGCEQLILLHCVSGYPSAASESNLRTIPDLASRFDVVTGLSDHTMGVAVPIAAIALGASVIEKHFTLRRADGGPDAAFSLEPEELRLMVEGCGTAWEALGRVSYERAPSEAKSLIFRRSLYVIADIGEGELLTEKNVRSIRPGDGLPPKYLPDVIGRRARRMLARGTALQWTDFQ